MDSIKKIVLGLFLTWFSLAIFAQQSEPAEKKNGGFQKDKLFTGGSLGLSFYPGGIAFGLSPYIGYSATTWLDAAISLNYFYTGQKDGYGNKYKQSNIGPGAFIKIYPLNFLFVQAQYEHNFNSNKISTPQGVTVSSYNAEVNSLLLGLGYCSGRGPSNNSYFYFSLLFDVLRQPSSPYIDYYGRLIPVIKAGYNIALFQGR